MFDSIGILSQVKERVNGDFLKETQEFFKGKAEDLKVVVIPDFFLDRLVSLNCDERSFFGKLESIAKKKGGSIDEIEQTDLRGGNAVNTMSALLMLGARVTPIICTSKLGTQLVKHFFRQHKLDLSHVKTFNDASMTTALEFPVKNGRINVMLRDLGALQNFGPADLDEEDFAAIEDADYTCVFNWAGTRRFGTQLAKTVFHRAKTRGRGKTYCDTADPTPNAGKIPELVKTVLQSKYVDILSVNENEAICYASQLGDQVRKTGKSLMLEEQARMSAKILASHLSLRVDLHTTRFAATYTKNTETIVPAFEVPVLRATGSGDAWNAGNIVGDANCLPDGYRLTLANAVAAYYISHPDGSHPTRKQLIDFCRKTELKSLEV